MKFKLDENLGLLGKSLLESEGHDVMTIAEQNLSGAQDERIYEHCRGEGRVLITLDRDFGQTIHFPPRGGPGIVVLECRGRVSPPNIVARVTELARLLRTRSVDGQLWIVEPGRLRMHESKDDL
jgi:predicted nuclease of predicted toxin-antitoxin system